MNEMSCNKVTRMKEFYGEKVRNLLKERGYAWEIYFAQGHSYDETLYVSRYKQDCEYNLDSEIECNEREGHYGIRRITRNSRGNYEISSWKGNNLVLTRL